MMTRLLALLPVLAIAACGPIPVQQAERICLERAHEAVQPRGHIAVGGGTDGAKASVGLTISSDFLLGRDPSAVFDQCVLQRSGQAPSQPLYSRTDWKG
jgi:hypothetical protein